ncbi:MAG TPA: hypothetical protein VHX16_10425 [Chloroflexota bacterium]|nr:hypothetical protein [Chloroflexota bacterium]
MTVLVSSPPAGAADTWARLVSRHYGRFLPGTPTIVVQDAPGGAGILMANRLADSAPDGLTIGMQHPQATAFQLHSEPAVRYDVTSWTWLGSPAVERYVFGIHKGTGVSPTNLDLLKTRTISSANVSPGDSEHLTQVALKLGLGWKIIPTFGFQGERETVLSLDRREADGVTLMWKGFISNQPDDLASRIIQPLVQFGGPRAELGATGLPIARDLFSTASPQAREALAYVEGPFSWSRALATAPNTDPRIGATMRAAMWAMMSDPEFLADASQRKLEITPTSGERVQSLIRDYMNTSSEILRLVEDQVGADTPR